MNNTIGTTCQYMKCCACSLRIIPVYRRTRRYGVCSITARTACQSPGVTVCWCVLRVVSAAITALLCNDAELHLHPSPDADWHIQGEPTGGALLTLAAKTGLDIAFEREAMVIVAAIFLGLTLPITPVQILWVNMVTAITLSLALAFEPAEANVMSRPPRDPSEPLLNAFLLWRVFFVYCLMVVGALGFFLWEQGRGESVEVARTVAVNALVTGEIFYLFNCRYLLASSNSLRSFTSSRTVLFSVLAVVVLQALFTYVPLFQKLFGTAAIDAMAWWRILLFGVLLFAAVEAEKMWLRYRNNT